MSLDYTSLSALVVEDNDFIRGMIVKMLRSKDLKAIQEANLGFNPVPDGKVVRIPLPEMSRERRQEFVKNAQRLAEEGFFEVFLPRRADLFRYQLRATRRNGEVREFRDPYSFLPTLGEQDLYLFNEGNEHRIYDKLGSHVRNLGGVTGVSFAVWAPSAARISVVGNFNHWDGRIHPMRSLGVSGVWELFVPGLGEGEIYKFELRDGRGHVRLKTDPVR